MKLHQLNGYWIVVVVRKNHELPISEMLVGKGYVTTVPRRPLCSKCKENCNGRPLFPGYLFLRFDASNPWHIVSTPGVMRIVSFGEIVPPMSDDEVRNLSIVTSCDRCKSVLSHSVPGKLVAITNGPLTGLKGIFSRNGSIGRLVISVSLFNRSVSVDLDDGDVMAMAD
jgi:transcriptional antiterminator NusG